MNINYEFYKVMNNYLVEKENELKGNELANYVRRDIPENLKNLLENYIEEDILVKGSTGMGSWANIPWVAIFIKKLTNKAQKGIYLVFLFSEDMSKLYLSLNQGVTYFNDNKINNRIKESSIKLRKKYFNYNKRYITKIDLKSNSSLAKDYENGHIIGYEYDMKNLLKEDILNDILKLFYTYEIIYKDIVKLGYENFMSILLNQKLEEINKVEGLIVQETSEGYDKEFKSKIRQGQSKLRSKVLEKEDSCRICNIKNKNLLIISHIKPWNKSNRIEKVDINNVLLLCPNHDALFDKGYISFDEEGKILISKLLYDNISNFNIDKNLKIELNINEKKYLKYHREKVFMK